MDRQRARSIPRKMNFNREPIGFLDSINDPIPHGLDRHHQHHHHSRPSQQQHPSHSSYDVSLICQICKKRINLLIKQNCRTCSHSTVLDHGYAPFSHLSQSSPQNRSSAPTFNQSQSYAHRYSKDNNPNVFDRLQRDYSDYSESGSLSSLSSWDRYKS